LYSAVSTTTGAAETLLWRRLASATPRRNSQVLKKGMKLLFMINLLNLPKRQLNLGRKE